MQKQQEWAKVLINFYKKKKERTSRFRVKGRDTWGVGSLQWKLNSNKKIINFTKKSLYDTFKLLSSHLNNWDFFFLQQQKIKHPLNRILGNEVNRTFKNTYNVPHSLGKKKFNHLGYIFSTISYSTKKPIYPLPLKGARFGYRKSGSFQKRTFLDVFKLSTNIFRKKEKQAFKSFLIRNVKNLLPVLGYPKFQSLETCTGWNFIQQPKFLLYKTPLSAGLNSTNLTTQTVPICTKNLNWINEWKDGTLGIVTNKYQNLLPNKKIGKLSKNDFNGATKSLQKFFFENRPYVCKDSNIVHRTMNPFLKRKAFLRYTTTVPKSFTPQVSFWYYSFLTRFVENTTGYRSFILLNPFLENFLTFKDASRCSIWVERILGFQRLLGPKIFFEEALQVTLLAIKTKDPFFFAEWLRSMLSKVGFWKYRIFLRFVKYLFQELFSPIFQELNFKGVKLKLKGKIGVAGNARTRTVFFRVGRTSQSRIKNKVNYNLSNVYTFTGVLGLQIWFFFS